MPHDNTNLFILGIGAIIGSLLCNHFHSTTRVYAASAINCDKPVPWNPTARAEYNALPAALKPAYIKKRQSIFKKLCRDAARAIHHDELYGGQPLDNKGGLVTPHFSTENSTGFDIHTAYAHAYVGSKVSIA